MSDVVSFRPDEEEARIIERTRRRLGLRTRADAVRHLVRAGARSLPRSQLPAFRLRFTDLRSGESLTSEEIDRVIYDRANEG